jgi:hypothetical protein
MYELCYPLWGFLVLPVIVFFLIGSLAAPTAIYSRSMISCL